MSDELLLVVLWEDAPSGANFAPGILLRACVSDALELTGAYDSRLRVAMRDHPCKGNHKLYNELPMQAELLRPPTRLIAVFDSDRIDDLAKRRSITPWPSAVPEQAEKLRAQLDLAPERVDVVLLVENMETVVDTATDLLQRARGAKELAHRDRTLHALASESKALRDALCDRVASWRALVDCATRALRAR